MSTALLLDLIEWERNSLSARLLRAAKDQRSKGQRGHDGEIGDLRGQLVELDGLLRSEKARSSSLAIPASPGLVPGRLKYRELGRPTSLI